ncbi:MAG: hypothetical protein M4D80_18760 [Myxococcota bacterium]|nr:hypothetical protein [Deltaproteobacteria bacterium]MDQ3337209.1 hypothetical protein [Myxococcota bacterium]
METITSAALASVIGGAEQQPSWGQRAWQTTKDFTGGFVAGAVSGRREDQPWGDSSSRASKAGGETGVMATMGLGQRIPRRR